MKRIRATRLIDVLVLAAIAVVLAWSFGDDSTSGVSGTTVGSVAANPAAAVGEDPDAEAEGGESDAEEAEELVDRQKWFDGQRTDGKGKLPGRAWQKAATESRKLRTADGLETAPLAWSLIGPRPIDGAATSWVYGGSTPYAGRITSIATHPTNAQVAYVGSANGGVWKTTDSGSTWTQIFDNAPATASMAIGAVAIDPSAPETIYVGTGEANFGESGYLGTGLYRSRNGGGTWSRVGGNLFDECAISSIVVKPGTSTTILLGVTSPNYSFNTICHTGNRYGIWRSTTDGTNWTRVAAAHASRVAVAPNNPAVFYAGIYNGGIYKSSNSGATWSVFTGGGLPASPFGRVDISVVPAPGLAQQQTVYAAIANHDAGWTLNGIYRSNDGGASWARLTSPGSNCAGQCYYNLTVAADPKNPDRMFAGLTYLNRYTSNVPTRIGYANPGTTGCPYSATGTTTNCIHVDFHALTYDASGRLWVGSDGGVYRTSDAGATFTNLNGTLSNIQYYPGVAGTLAGPLVGGAQDNGSSRLTTGQTWRLVGGGDGGHQAIAKNGQVTLSTWQQGRVHRIVDGVYCTYDENPGPAEVGKRGLVAFIAPLTGSPTNTNTVYAGTYRIYRTTNANAGCGLMTWQTISQNFLVGTAADVVTAIAPASDGVTVYASTASGKVYVTGGSTTWALRSTGLPGREIGDFWVSPTAPGTAYAAVHGFDATGRHLYKTTNFGVNWSTVSGNLPNSSANAVVVDTTTVPATIYVGMDHGVFWSNDDGVSWQNTSIDLPRTVVYDLLIDKTAKKLIAATHGRGMWTAPLIGGGVSGPGHDAFASAKSAAALPYADAGVSTTTATTQSGEDIDPSCTAFIGKTVWYRYSPATTTSVTANTTGSSFDTVIVAFAGTSLGALTEVGCDDDGGGVDGGPSKTASINVTAGQTYYFQVGGWTATSGGAAESGTLNFNLVQGGPVNDAFVSATIVTSAPFSSTGTNTAQATNQASEDRDPSCADFVGKTVWYKFVPGSNMTVTANTLGSSFDTVLVAFQGTSLAGLTEVGCDDDAGAPGGSSRIDSLALTAGQTYYFQAGGWIATLDGAAASGTLNFNLVVAGPTNDLFAGAIVIGALPYTDAGRSTVLASTEDGEDVDPSCTDFVGKTVWYKYVPGASGTRTVDTLGSNFDTVIVVFQGTTLGGLAEVACDDDGGGGAGGPSKITSFAVTSGQTYYFQVGGWRSSVGTPASGNLTFKLATP